MISGEESATPMAAIPRHSIDDEVPVHVGWAQSSLKIHDIIRHRTLPWIFRSRLHKPHFFRTGTLQRPGMNLKNEMGRNHETHKQHENWQLHEKFGILSTLMEGDIDCLHTMPIFRVFRGFRGSKLLFWDEFSRGGLQAMTAKALPIRFSPSSAQAKPLHTPQPLQWAGSFSGLGLLFGILSMGFFFAEPTMAKDSISDYFLRLPASEFLEGTPAQLLGYIKNNAQGTIDTKNGYIFFQGDGAQVSLQAALFRFPDGQPLLAVTYGFLEEPNFTQLDFFLEQDGKMVRTKRMPFPVPRDGSHLRFELPRTGRTIVIKNPSGRVLTRATWNGSCFVKE